MGNKPHEKNPGGLMHNNLGRRAFKIMQDFDRNADRIARRFCDAFGMLCIPDCFGVENPYLQVEILLLSAKMRMILPRQDKDFQ
jgi:hypothetical protein